MADTIKQKGPMPPAGSATIMAIEAHEQPGPAGTPVYLWHVSVFSGGQQEPLEVLYQAIQARFQQMASAVKIIQILSVVSDDLTDALHEMYATLQYHRLAMPAWWQAPGDETAKLLPGGLAGYVQASGPYAQPGTALRQPEGLFNRAWFLQTLAAIEGIAATPAAAPEPAVVATPTGELRAGTIEGVKPIAPAAKPVTAPKPVKPRAKAKAPRAKAKTPASTAPPSKAVKAEA